MRRLILHRINSTEDLCQGLRSCLAGYGLQVDNERRAWRPAALKPADSGIRYADGYVFYVVPLHSQLRGLTVLPHRFFFVSDDLTPTRRPASELGSRCARLAQFRRRDRIKACAALLKACGRDSAVCDPEPIAADATADLTCIRSAAAGDESRDANPSLPFARLPSRSRWLITSHVLRRDSLAAYAAALRGALKRCNISNIELLPLDAPPTSADLQELAADPCIVLVGINGSRGRPLDEASRTLLGTLDNLRIPYRLFADASLTNRFAALDQVPHLITLAGGQPYKIGLGSSSSGNAFLGIDLGHSPHTPNRSRVVLTCVASDGRLLGYWTGSQPRDETLRPEILQAGLHWLRDHLLPGYPDIRTLIALRDGRIFPNERILHVLRTLPQRTITVECIKHPTPYLATGDEPAPPGTFLRLGSATTGIAFLQPPASPVKVHLTHALKVRMATPTPTITLEEVGAWIFGLCYAPALGRRATSSPSPIYWADGLAGLSPTNHQFAGLHHIPHN